MTERAVILSTEKSLGIKDFPIRNTPVHSEGNLPLQSTLKDAEITLIRHTLQQCDFNQQAAAELLGITRDSLFRKLKKYHIIIKHDIGPS